MIRKTIFFFGIFFLAVFSACQDTADKKIKIKREIVRDTVFVHRLPAQVDSFDFIIISRLYHNQIELKKLRKELEEDILTEKEWRFNETTKEISAVEMKQIDLIKKLEIKYKFN